MKRDSSNKGFTVVEILVVIVVVVGLGLGGWLVYQRNNDAKTAVTASDTSSQSQDAQDITVTAPEEIKSTKDLDAAGSALDSVNLDSDTADKELDSALNF